MPLHPCHWTNELAKRFPVPYSKIVFEKDDEMNPEYVPYVYKKPTIVEPIGSDRFSMTASWEIFKDTCYGGLGTPGQPLIDDPILMKAVDAVNRFLAIQEWVARVNTAEEYEVAKMALKKASEDAEACSQIYFLTR